MFLGTMGWIALGLIVGFIASKSLNLRGDDPKMGITLAGAGGLIGGWLYSLISGTAVSGFNTRSLMFAGLVAVVVLIVWHASRRHSLSRY
jgi:uncharacterized membrane protein YeaQ/YmgE (transglycosylase-associated protein family)